MAGLEKFRLGKRTTETCVHVGLLQNRSFRTNIKECACTLRFSVDKIANFNQEYYHNVCINHHPNHSAYRLIQPPPPLFHANLEGYFELE